MSKIVIPASFKRDISKYGITRVAPLAGFPTYISLWRYLRKGTIPRTDKAVARLNKTAEIIGSTFRCG